MCKNYKTIYFMKKIMLVGAVALLGLASCKKDYTCECTVVTDMTSIGEGKSTSTISETIKDTKSKATEACEKSNVTTTYTTSTCKIK